MIQLIVGNEGKGKTKEMLERVNSEIKEVSGNIVYLDKNTKHMYELNNKIRLVSVSDFSFTSSDEFYGFICGIISQDHDLEQLYIDNFKRLANVDNDGLSAVLEKFDRLSEERNIKFCISISTSADQIPAAFAERIIVSL